MKRRELADVLQVALYRAETLERDLARQVGVTERVQAELSKLNGCSYSSWTSVSTSIPINIPRSSMNPQKEVALHKPGGSEAKSGFWFATCSCSWQEQRPENEDDGWAAQTLDQHRQVCKHPMRTLTIPMWSVVTPWYWSSPDTPYGLEMDWRPAGSHSVKSPFGQGHEEKTWRLFSAGKETA